MRFLVATAVLAIGMVGSPGHCGEADEHLGEPDLIQVTHVLENGTLWVGTNELWGSSIVSLRYLGGTTGAPNWVDNGTPDAGRQIQASLYKAGQSYPDCFPGCSTNPPCSWGWNPVQAGNACNDRSGSTIWSSSSTALTTVTVPYQWNTHASPQRSMVEVRQELRLLPDRPNVLQIDYQITNNEVFVVANKDNEMPVVYLKSFLDQAWTYRGSAPWEMAPAEHVSVPIGPPDVAVQLAGANSERWVAWIGPQGQGLGMYAPTANQPSNQSNEYFNFGRRNPPGSTATSYMQHWDNVATPPGGTFSVRVFLIAGTLEQIRRAVYEMSGHGAKLSVGAASVTEGNGGQGSMLFPVTLSPSWTVPVTVSFATADQTATAGSDYTAVSGTLTFVPGGPTLQTIVVPVNPDSLHEAGETFLLNLSGAAGAVITAGQGTGTIINDDPPPVLSISSPTVTEGNSGVVNATFDVSLSAPSGMLLTTNYSTASGTAASGTDYMPAAGTVTFQPGVQSRTITVQVQGDVLDEYNETVFVDLSNYIVSGQWRGTGTIADNDPPPSLVLSDATIVEGNSGTSSVTFPYNLSVVSGKTIAFNFATANGTATSPQDFVSASGPVSIPPGALSGQISVAVTGDLLVEPTETFLVSLSGAVADDLTISDGSANGTITDTDVAYVSVSDVALTEGNSGSLPASFIVSLSTPHYQPVTVQYATSDGTANVGSDYTAASGTVTFVPPATAVAVPVSILGDLLDEEDETFAVGLSNPSLPSAPLLDGVGQGIIVDNDPQPNLTVSDATVTEGNCGHTPLNFVVSLSTPSGKNVLLRATTVGQTAIADVDFGPSDDSYGMLPGSPSFVASVAVKGDQLPEPTETLRLVLSNVVNATLVDSEGVGTILDNDATLGVGGSELVHGSDEWRALPADGVDRLAISQRAYSSYEVVIESPTGSMASPTAGPFVERVNCGTASLAQSSDPIGSGFARSLRWTNEQPTSINDQLVRVTGQCAPTCGSQRYRARAYETTYAFSRFNNVGTQYTVLQLQNPTTYAVAGRLFFWSEAGTLVASQAVDLVPRQLLTLDTRTVTDANNRSGSITFANNARYGDLTGKAVGIDLGIGEAFETPMVVRSK